MIRSLNHIVLDTNKENKKARLFYIFYNFYLILSNRTSFQNKNKKNFQKGKKCCQMILGRILRYFKFSSNFNSIPITMIIKKYISKLENFSRVDLKKTFSTFKNLLLFQSILVASRWCFLVRPIQKLKKRLRFEFNFNCSKNIFQFYYHTCSRMTIYLKSVHYFAFQYIFI